MSDSFSRICPKCNLVIAYKHKRAFVKANKTSPLCGSCNRSSRKRPIIKCTREDCSRNQESIELGLCHNHYEQVRLQGNPELRIHKNKIARIRANKPEVKARDKIRLRQTSYRYNNHCLNAKRRQLLNDISLERFIVLTTNLCIYCGSLSPNRNYTGLDRKNNTIGYTLENTVPCCSICNYMKRIMESTEFINKCKQIVSHQEKE